MCVLSIVSKIECHSPSVNNIFSRCCCLLSALSSIPSAIMPRTSSADQGLVEKAVDKLKMHPTLTVVDAMHLAGFTEDERKDKNIQRLVLRRLPSKGKHAYLSMMASTDSGRDGVILEQAHQISCHHSPIQLFQHQPAVTSFRLVNR
jgi:hypothetical protein